MAVKSGGKPMRESERRRYFRVDDVLPIILRRVGKDWADVKGKTIPGLLSGVGYPNSPDAVPDESINPHLWRMLVDISHKLSLMLDNMYLTSQGLTCAQNRKVSLSASGIRTTTEDRFDAGDYVEIKMLLTANTSFWVVLYGKVARVQPVDESGWEVAIDFLEMGDEVMNLLNLYTLSRQRETKSSGTWKKD
jgi:hypothetical protein